MTRIAFGAHSPFAVDAKLRTVLQKAVRCAVAQAPLLSLGALPLSRHSLARFCFILFKAIRPFALNRLCLLSGTVFALMFIYF